MFMWFWTIFSLGAPELLTLSLCLYEKASWVSYRAWSRLLKVRSQKKSRPNFSYKHNDNFKRKQAWAKLRSSVLKAGQPKVLLRESGSL